FSEKCDFETDLCKPLREVSLHPGWIRRNGNSGVGPPYSDHNGNYTSFSEKCDFETDLCKPLREITFQYWISQGGVLMVGLQKLSEDAIKNIWHDSGELQNQWKAKTITVNSTENFEVGNVIFHGIVESQGQDETVAIDDVSFSQGCSLASEAVIAFLCLSALQTSSFELGMCEWNLDQAVVPASWVQLQSGHKIASCSSLKDHSNDTKEANDNALYRSAYLNSSMCNCSSKNCHFQFQYSMADSSVLKAILYTNQ
ncbi:UNVERIFIED_CONTAM: hypothetical protein H355_001157, partial [Colinus virginianus]